MSVGKNSYVKTHPLQQKHADRVGLNKKCFLHAEIHAIAKCKQLERAHKIVVMRFDTDGRPANAKPCPICQDALLHTPIKHIEHT